MPGSPSSKGFNLSEIFWLAVMLIGVIVVLVMLGKLMWPKIEANWFPAPTLEPGQIFLVRHDRDFECSEQAIVVLAPITPSYVLSALVDMEKVGAWDHPEGESLEGWSALWVYDHKQDRLEYWIYGAGSGDGLVFELLPRCFSGEGEYGIPYIEFSEVEVRKINPTEQGDNN